LRVHTTYMGPLWMPHAVIARGLNAALSVSREGVTWGPIVFGDFEFENVKNND